MSDIQFRKARPEDADSVALLMYESSMNLMDYYFGFKNADVSPFLKYDFLRGRGLFGYRNQMVGVNCNGEIIATLTVYPGRKYRQLAFHTMVSAMRYYGFTGFFEVFKRSLSLMRLFIIPSPDSLFLANACVVKSCRCNGVFTHFYEYVYNIACNEGFKSIQLDVSFSNARAQKLYVEDLKFKIVDERSQFNGKFKDGFRRLEVSI